MKKKIFLMLAFFAGSVAIIVTTLIANYFIMAWTEPNLSPPVDNMIIGASIPKFITPVPVFSGIIQDSYVSFDASSFIPAGTQIVLLQAECGIDGPNQDVEVDLDAHIRIRKNSTSPSFILTRGRSAAAKDSIALGNQGFFSVESDGTFQYIVEYPGFNKGCEINLIGYF